MLTVLSHGAGQDSAALMAMWRHYPEYREYYIQGDFLVICSYTGNEHPETYTYVQDVKADAFRDNVEFVHIAPDMGYHGVGWTSLDEQMDRNETVFSKAFPKSCTDNLKLKPIYRYLTDHISRTYGPFENLEKKYRTKAPLVAFAKKYGKIRMILGIAAGEEKRVTKAVNRPKWQELAVEHIYPLLDMGMDRAACQRYLRAVNETVPWPSCCLKCPWMNLQELLWLAQEFPEVYKDWCRQEAAKMAKNKKKGVAKNVGVWGNTKTLPEMLVIAKQKYPDMTAEEIRNYRFSHGHCNASAY